MSSSAIDLAALGLREGEVSEDGVAVVGREGHLYLWGGSNGLVDQYAVDDAVAREIAAAWTRVITRRAEAVRALGAVFAQLVVPDKSSLLPEYFPAPITTPTPYLAHLELGLKGQGVGYLSAFDLLGDDPTAIKRTDTHLSAPGAIKLVRALHAALGLPEPPPLRTEPVSMRGDLLASFGPDGEGVTEDSPRVVKDDLPPAYGRVKLTAQHHPGHHVGTRMSWRNPTAPIPKTALAFGNSYFAIGRHSEQLSWHFARNFREFHFVWDGAMDVDLVKQLRPDVVVCQTVERFLPVVPAT